MNQLEESSHVVAKPMINTLFRIEVSNIKSFLVDWK